MLMYPRLAELREDHDLSQAEMAKILRGLIYTDREGQEHLLPADAVLCAVGMRARTGVMEELWNVVDEQYVIGDCVKPAQVTQAISDAYYLAKSL